MSLVSQLFRFSAPAEFEMRLENNIFYNLTCNILSNMCAKNALVVLLYVSSPWCFFFFFFLEDLLYIQLIVNHFILFYFFIDLCFFFSFEINHAMFYNLHSL